MMHGKQLWDRIYADRMPYLLLGLDLMLRVTALYSIQINRL